MPRQGSFPLATTARIAFLCVATAVAYAPSMGGGFLIDDDILLTDSRLIRAGDGLLKFWFSFESVDYWPVSNSSLWLEWRLWGDNPLGYRITNLLLHLGSCLLLWRLLSRLAVPGAYLAALLFALHPVNVETVAWIAQRKTLLAFAFSLLATLCYLASERGATAWYAAAIGALALALLSKISVAVVPILIAIAIAWKRPLAIADARRLLPMLGLACVIAAVNLWIRAADPGIPAGTAPIERPLAAAAALWIYLEKALRPVGLAFMYPIPPTPPEQPLSWLPLTGALTASTILWQRRRGRLRPLAFAWAFYVVALLPALGLTERLLIEDHYQHLALIAVVAPIAAAAANLRAGPARTPAIVATGVAVLALATLTWKHSATFVDNVTLMRASVEQFPDSAVAHHNLGFALLGEGHKREAIAALRRSLALDPASARAHRELGAALIESGDPAEAIAHLRATLQLEPNHPGAHHNLGAALRATGEPEQAVEQFRAALRTQPDAVRTHCALAKALLEAGDAQGAQAQLETAIEMDPGSAEARRLLAVAREQTRAQPASAASR